MGIKGGNIARAQGLAVLSWGGRNDGSWAKERKEVQQWWGAALPGTVPINTQRVKNNAGSFLLPVRSCVCHWLNLAGGQKERVSGKYSLQRSIVYNMQWSRGWAGNVSEHKQAEWTPWEQTSGLPHLRCTSQPDYSAIYGIYAAHIGTLGGE